MNSKAIPKPSSSVARISPMDRRDIIMVLAVLVLTVALTWAGTDYIVSHVMQPLMDDEASPTPDYPTH
jgi:predicted metal-binding membrane protein